MSIIKKTIEIELLVYTDTKKGFYDLLEFIGGPSNLVKKTDSTCVICYKIEEEVNQIYSELKITPGDTLMKVNGKIFKKGSNNAILFP